MELSLNTKPQIPDPLNIVCRSIFLISNLIKSCFFDDRSKPQQLTVKELEETRKKIEFMHDRIIKGSTPGTKLFDTHRVSIIIQEADKLARAEKKADSDSDFDSDLENPVADAYYKAYESLYALGYKYMNADWMLKGDEYLKLSHQAVGLI